MTLAREADLARALIEGRAKPKNQEERNFVAKLNKLTDFERYEKMEELEYNLTQAINKDIYEGFDLDKLLAGKDPWPEY